VLAHALGTPFAPDTRGALLLLEDVGEETYRLDRLLHHLRLAGVFDGVRGVLLGSLEAPPTRRPFPPDGDLGQVLSDVLLPLRVPVVRGLPLGHLPGKWTVPLGTTAVLDTQEGTIAFEPSP
jgi:muramoyltetrapeptide carboxypeptidase